jgi:acetylornithine deacetylase/succinyl-diaminopimelate desuccinylase-like protein
MTDHTAAATALLQDLIQNACVNDGRPESGEEIRSADLLIGYLEGAGLDIERYEPQPGRRSVLAKIEGSDPNAPSLLLMGHTDVVPVNVDGWSRDPFSGELVDGMVWGRGAVDMLNLTASMAVAFRQLADTGFTPKGTISYLAVADEEARGVWGADWLIDHELDDVKADYVITESGGFQVPTANGTRLPVMVEEKGTYWSKLTVKGTPGHASSPYKTDNALITAAEVVRRLAEFQPPPELSGTWRRLVEGLGLPDELLREEGFVETIDRMPLGFGRIAHSCTHTTFAPTVVHGGTKTNVIPDEVQIEVDIRTLPGQSGEHAQKLLHEAIGADLLDKVDIESGDDPSSRSEIDTPLWDALGRVTSRLCEGSALVPWLMTGATDNRFFRRAGSVGYGFGLFSKRLQFEDYMTMFHGNDERVDQESLGLSTDLWLAIAEEFVGPHSG